MAWVSFSLSPVASDLERRSLPAKSIRFSTPATRFSHNSRMHEPQSVLLQPTRDLVVSGGEGAPLICWPVVSWLPTMLMLKTMWLREDCSLAAVAPTERMRVALASRSRTLSGRLQSTASRKEMDVPPLSSCVIWCFFPAGGPFPSRSLSSSL